MKIRKVLSALFYEKERIAEVREIFSDSEFVQVDYRNSEAIARELKGADVALLPADVDERFLGENSLKWIHCDHAGLNHSARPEIFEKGIILTGAAGRSAPVLAEHAVYFMLQSCYHTKELIYAQQHHHWGVEGQENWKGLYGRTAGIIGLGNNGKMLAERLHAFGMKLITYDRYEVEGLDYAEKTLCREHKDTPDMLLRNSDFIILCAGLNDETYHMLDAEAFDKMKDGVVLVNISRGELIDTTALEKALRDGKVSCAGLDVFEEEPLLSESPLWEMEQVYITPHVTPQVPDRTGRSIDIIRENAKRYRDGKSLLNQLSREDVYREKRKQKEMGTFGIDSKVSDLLTDEAAVETLLELLEEAGQSLQGKENLKLAGNYRVRQLFSMLPRPLTEEELKRMDDRLRESFSTKNQRTTEQRRGDEA